MLAVAPIKALCSQCYENWRQKFGPLGLNCKELTGDTEIDDFFEVQDAHVIMTTPVGQAFTLVLCGFRLQKHRWSGHIDHCVHPVPFDLYLCLSSHLQGKVGQYDKEVEA